MYSGPEIHGFSPRRILVRCFPDFNTDTDFRHGAHVAAGVSTFGRRSGPMGSKLEHVQFNSSRSNSTFARSMFVDLFRYHLLLENVCRSPPVSPPTALKIMRSYEPHYRTLVPPLAVRDRQTFSVKS